MLATDYRKFRLNKINTPGFRHLWFLLIWPIYTIRYVLLSALHSDTASHVIYSALDDSIPFVSWFVIFYVLWYVFIFGMHIYLALFDIPVYRKYSKFIIIAMSISSLTFLIYPSHQELRPAAFENRDLFTWIIGIIYAVDGSINVFPSEHVIGALAVMFAGLHTPTLSVPMKVLICILAILISASTVFIKQHSILDVFAAVALDSVVYILCYLLPTKRNVRES